MQNRIEEYKIHTKSEMIIMTVCKRLHSMLKDELTGISEYKKLNSEMPSEHKQHKKIIDNIIRQETKHSKEVKSMIKDMNC